jgi:hypothetical protein
MPVIWRHLTAIGVFGAIIAIAFWPFLWQRWKQRVSRDWPQVPANVVSGEIKKEYGPEGGSAFFTLHLTYQYAVGDASYLGSYVARVGEAEGEHLLRSLQNGPLFVRHHPTKLTISVLEPYRDVLPA